MEKEQKQKELAVKEGLELKELVESLDSDERKAALYYMQGLKAAKTALQAVA